jgi:hypothetical protein
MIIIIIIMLLFQGQKCDEKEAGRIIKYEEPAMKV